MACVIICQGLGDGIFYSIMAWFTMSTFLRVNAGTRCSAGGFLVHLHGSFGRRHGWGNDSWLLHHNNMCLYTGCHGQNSIFWKGFQFPHQVYNYPSLLWNLLLFKFEYQFRKGEDYKDQIEDLERMLYYRNVFFWQVFKYRQQFLGRLLLWYSSYNFCMFLSVSI